MNLFLYVPFLCSMAADQCDYRECCSEYSGSESCESSGSFSDEDKNFNPWLEKVDPRGELFYIEKEFFFPAVKSSVKVLPCSNPIPVKSSKLVDKFRNLMTKYKQREWKSSKLKENLETKEFFNHQSFISQEVYIDINASRQSLGRRVTLAEELLGLRLSPVELTNIHMIDKIKIVGFISDKEVLGLKPGDWLHSINDENVYFSNIDDVLKKLDLPTKVKLTILSPCQNYSELDYFSSKHCFIAEELLGNSDVIGEVKSQLNNIPHGVLFLKTNCLSENDTAINESVIYKYPDENSALFLLKGMFITISHMIKEFTSAPILSCSLDVKGQRMHVGFFEEENIMVLFAAPLLNGAGFEVQHIVRNLGKVLKFQNFLNEKEFVFADSIRQMDKFFSMFFKYFLSDQSGHLTLSEPLLYDILPSVPWLPLPLELKTEINDILTELESSDFGNSSDGFYEKQRIYSILGSCLFYKGYLLSSHFPKEDLIDIYLFLRYNHVFSLTKDQTVSRIIIWKEVFPRYNHQCPCFTDSDLEKSERRCFLLTIAMNCSVLSILLEAGGCAMKVEDNTPPDPFYIEEAQNTLIILHSCGIISAVKKIFQACLPSLTSPDMLLKKDSSTWNLSKILSSSSNSVNAIGIAGSSNIYDKEESDADSDCSDTSNEMFEPLGSSTNVSITTRSTTDSQESSDYLNYMQKTNISSATEGNNLSSTFEQKLRTFECGSTVFQYLHVDPVEGIYIAPFHNEYNFHQGTIYNAVLKNFHQSCINMRQTFAKSLRNKEVLQSNTNTKFGVNKFLCSAYEQGILFSHIPKDNNKQKNAFNFWIVGRLFFTPQAREVYVCYHDSIQQDMVEIAFKLGFGLLL